MLLGLAAQLTELLLFLSCRECALCAELRCPLLASCSLRRVNLCLVDSVQIVSLADQCGASR